MTATIKIFKFVGVNRYGQDIARTVRAFLCPVETLAIELARVKNLGPMYWVEVDGKEVNL